MRHPRTQQPIDTNTNTVDSDESLRKRGLPHEPAARVPGSNLPNKKPAHYNTFKSASGAIINVIVVDESPLLEKRRTLAMVEMAFAIILLNNEIVAIVMKNSSLRTHLNSALGIWVGIPCAVAAAMTLVMTRKRFAKLSQTKECCQPTKSLYITLASLFILCIGVSACGFICANVEIQLAVQTRRAWREQLNELNTGVKPKVDMLLVPHEETWQYMFVKAGFSALVVFLLMIVNGIMTYSVVRTYWPKAKSDQHNHIQSNEEKPEGPEKSVRFYDKSDEDKQTEKLLKNMMLGAKNSSLHYSEEEWNPSPYSASDSQKELLK